MLRWARCYFDKNCTGTGYAKLMFLRPVESTGHLGHSGASEPRNIGAIFFMLRSAWHGFYKKHVRTRYAELMVFPPVGSMGHIVHFSATGARNFDTLFFYAWVVTVQIPQKA
jgi:hypothetical protein